MWITEEGPPRDPNRSRPSKASRAAWHNRGPRTRSGLNQQSYNSNKSSCSKKHIQQRARTCTDIHIQDYADEPEACTYSTWNMNSARIRTQLLCRDITEAFESCAISHSMHWLSKLTIPASLAASPHDYRVWSSPWPCRWNWHSAPVLRCLSCLHAPKYHSPSYMWGEGGGGAINKQTRK